MTFIFTPDYHIKLSWLIAILLLTAARFSAGSVGRLSVLDPKHGSAIVDGRTQVAWRVQGTVDGEYVSVFLDGQLLVITSAKAEGSLHLLGAPHGPHELVITLSRTPMKAHNFVHGALHDETAAVEFVSISEEGGEWMPELASLRNTFLHTKQRLLQIDAHARNFEQTLQDLQTTLRAACGTRGLAPTREPPGCSSKCADTGTKVLAYLYKSTNTDSCCANSGNEAVCPQHRCSATCCQIAGRCVELEKSLETRGDSDWDGANEAGGGVGGASFAQAEARLRDTYAELLSKHRGFLSRQFALQSAPVMRPGASATVIWMAGQYAGMEADYIELLLDGAYRVAINDTDLSTYAPNAMVIVQETFPVHGKPSFWQPFTAYLASFAKYGGQPLLYQHELLYPPAPSVLDESDTTPAALPADSDSHSQMNELRAQRRIDERGGGVSRSGGPFRVAVLLTSDEKYMAPAGWLAHTHFVARNCWHPELHQYAAVVAIPFGIKSGFLLPSERTAWLQQSRACSSLPMPRDSTNKYVRWNFVGNANSSRARMLLIDEVAANGGAEVLRGKMILTHAFDDPIHGLVLSRYRELLASSTFTFCPEGVHVESYRVWEALEVSSIPITTCDSYFEGLLGDGHPLPCVHEWSWSALQATMEQVELDSTYVCKVSRWYQSYRQSLVDAFRRTLMP